MGQLALVAMLAGTALSAVGSAKEGEAAQKSANANARLSAIDAANESYRIARTADQVQSRNVTRIAKSGVTMSGSPLDVLVSNELEASRQQNAIARSQRAYESIMHKQGQAAVEAARWNIAGGVLRGFGSALGGSGFTFAGTAGGGGTGWGPSGSGAGLGLYQPNFGAFSGLGLRRGGV